MMKSIFLIYIVLYSSYILPNVTSEIQTTFDKYYPTSCQDPSIIEDGEYQIYPDGLVPVTVYCEVTKGGWTTIFNKVTKCDFFNQSWTDYLYGFGSPVSNYWAGLVNMRNLVLTEPMTLRIELSNSAEDEFFIEYESFYIGPEENGFVLHVGNRTRGNLVDSFSPMSRAKFYTFDKFKPPVVNSNSSNIPRFGPINNNKLALMHRVTVNETVIDTPYEIKASYFRGAWWYTLEGDSSVCLTCNPKTPFEGNWQQHTNLLSFSQAKMMLRPRNEFRPSNCYDIYKQGGIKQDGIYNIYLSDSSKPTRVYCEMQKGGWTRIFNRIDRLTPTYDRLWSEYKDGFGEIEENHWLGLRSIQALTYQELMTLRIEVASDTKRDSEFIEHPAFLVYSENQMFKMVVNASNRGTLQDWMFNNHNGMIFYTKDVDSVTNCATDNLGGWWFNPSNCYRVCLTCAKLTLGQYSAIGSDPTYPTSRKNFMKMLIRPTHI